MTLSRRRGLVRVGPRPATEPRRLLPAAIALASVAAVACPLHALASKGYSGYEGQFSSTAPSGYPAAPSPLTPGSALSYEFTVSNESLLFGGTPGGRVYVQRITSVNGNDVSSGSPALSEDAVLAAATTGGSPSSSPLPAQQIGPLGGSASYAIPVQPVSCGYWGVWVEDVQAGVVPDIHDSNRDVLNAGVIRVSGCAAPTPTPRPSTTPGSRAGPSSAPRGTSTASQASSAPAGTVAGPSATGGTPSPATATATPPAAATTAGAAFAGVAGITTPSAGSEPIATNSYRAGSPTHGISPVLASIALLSVASAAAVGPLVGIRMRRRRRSVPGRSPRTTGA